jgi:hypothetical protein
MTASANSIIVSLDSFKDVQQLLLQQKHPKQTLLVMDDDDTLTMMPCPTKNHCQYLGGPAWFAWQSKLPQNSKQRIWKSFPALLSINNLIFSMSKMPLTDSHIPVTLKIAQQQGIKTIVASARGYDMVNPTETQFTQDGIFDLIRNNAIKTPDDHTGFPGIYNPAKWNNKSVRAIAYVHGILYLAGQNKGVMLQQFLAKTKNTRKIRMIIFVDDTMQNVKEVASAYAKDANMNAVSIHFTRLASHKAAFLSGKNAKKWQAQATQQWFAIRHAMRKNLIGSNF